MIIKKIKIFLQNVCKNILLTNIILEKKKEFDIIFTQEPLWSILQYIFSSTNEKGKNIVEVSNYLN